MKREIVGQGSVVVLVVAIVAAVVGGAIGYLLKPEAEVPPDIAELQAQISDLEGTVSTQQSKISELEGTVSDLEAQLAEAPSPLVIKVGVMGKSVHPYWEVVNKGVMAAETMLNEQFAAAGRNITVEATFWVPTKEDVPAQLATMETWIAGGFDGIAVAPSDPGAMASDIQDAMNEGIPTITIDTDAPDSARLVYLGTNNYEAGRLAGDAMIEALTERGVSISGAKLAMQTGSLTATNSLERMAGFEDVVEAAGATVLEPMCDFEDPDKAADLAAATIAANPDLVGAFGVYAYNGPAWAGAVEDAGKVGDITIVEFDATKPNIEPIKADVCYATMAQRQYFQGYYAVELLVLAKLWGTEAALKFFVPNYPANDLYDTGIDVVTHANLAEYAAALDARGEPYDWTP